MTTITQEHETSRRNHKQERPETIKKSQMLSELLLIIFICILVHCGPLHYLNYIF